MDDLIKALQIFRKYANQKYPTNCDHDQLAVVGVAKEMVSTEDIVELQKLGFFWADEEECFISFKFGSC